MTTNRQSCCDTLPAIREISLEADQLSADFESHRRITPDFAKKIKNLGIYNILVPENLNGFGCTLVEWFKAIRVLASGDASLAWCVAHGSMTSAILSSISGGVFREEYFRESRNTAAWSNLSDVKGKPCQGGIVVSGSWRFVTGCTNADFVGGSVTIPPTCSDEGPLVRSVLVPASKVSIVESWNPIGLVGSGSHNVEAENIFVPTDNIFYWPRPWQDNQFKKSSRAASENPTNSLTNGTWPISICCAATQIGIAERALAELEKSLEGKKDFFSGKYLIERPHIITMVEQAHSDLLVAQYSFEYLLAEAWKSAIEQGQLDKKLRMEIRLASVNITHMCRDIVRVAFDATGASALDKSGNLEKLYRDSSCLTSHVSVSKSSFEITSLARHDLEKSAWL